MPLPPNATKEQIANALMAAFEITANPASSNALAKNAQVPAQLALDALADLVHACNRDWRWLQSLLMWLAHQGAGAPNRLDWLRTFHRVLGANDSSLPPGISDNRWQSLAQACAQVPAADRQNLRRFAKGTYGAAGMGAKKDIKAIEALFHSLVDPANVLAQFSRVERYQDNVLPVISALVSSGGISTSLSAVSMPTLCYLYSRYPPHSGHFSFNRWGPGDSQLKDPSENMVRHFRKHVMGEKKPGDERFGSLEYIAWWIKLGISLTRQDYLKFAQAPDHHKLIAFDGDLPLEGRRLKAFILSRGIEDEPGLVDFVTDQALADYRTCTVVSSGLMRRVLVHSDGNKVFISGVHENMFIIGRRDGEQLGISSAYIPASPQALQDKLAGALKNICWMIKN